MSAPASPSAPSATPLVRFATIVEALCRAMAADAHASGIAGPLAVLIFTRLRRLAARFVATVARGPVAGRARPASSRTRSPSRRPDPPGCPSQRLAQRLAQPLPRRFGWLRTLLPATAGGASQLAHLLAEPEMAALIAANPATGRALRPLCHLLGIRPPQALRRPPATDPQAAPPAEPPPAPARPAAQKPRSTPRPPAVQAPRVILAPSTTPIRT